MNRILLALVLATSVAALAQTKAEKKDKKAAAPAPVAATAKPAAAPAPAAAFVANKDSKTFHRADCKAAAKIKEANRTSFASAAEANKAGYKACKVCKP
jgi:hypothetical protein